MARIVPLLELPGIRVHRFDHPVEHEDQPYEEIADTFMASFVEDGTFDLHVGDRSWRARRGDVMLSHPGMRFRADFEGKGFNDTCLSVTYKSAADDGFDAARSWARSGRSLLASGNRTRYLYWGLKQAVDRSDLCWRSIARPRSSARTTAPERRCSASKSSPGMPSEYMPYGNEWSGTSAKP